MGAPLHDYDDDDDDDDDDDEGHCQQHFYHCSHPTDSIKMCNGFDFGHPLSLESHDLDL